MRCGVCHRHSSDLAWLWLWHRPAATVPIRPLAWEFPYASSVALKRPKKKNGLSSKGPFGRSGITSHRNNILSSMVISVSEPTK